MTQRTSIRSRQERRQQEIEWVERLDYGFSMEEEARSEAVTNEEWSAEEERISRRGRWALGKTYAQLAGWEK